MALDLRCGARGCSTPALKSGLFNALLASDATVRSLTALVNGALSDLTEGGARSPLVRGVNNGLRSAVAHAPERCGAAPTTAPTTAPTPEFTPAAIRAAVLVGGLGGSLLILVVGATIVLHSWRRLKRARAARRSHAHVGGGGVLRRVQRFALSLAAPIVESELEEGALGDGGGPRVAGELAAPCCGGSTLICHPGLPLILRLALPVVLVGAVTIYLSAHTHVGATVDITMALVGDAPIHIPRLFAFSLGNTVHDMWQAGVYPLAFLIALLSGGWPYLKVRPRAAQRVGSPPHHRPLSSSSCAHAPLTPSLSLQPPRVTRSSSCFSAGPCPSPTTPSSSLPRCAPARSSGLTRSESGPSSTPTSSSSSWSPSASTSRSRCVHFF